MTAVIIDDDKKIRDQLTRLLSKHCSNVQIVGQEASASAGAILISSATPDIVFLDIQMPGGTGFDMLHTLGNYNFSLVIVSGYEEYAIKAIKASALDFLLKPVNPTELILAVSKAERKESWNSLHVRIMNMQATLHNPQRDEHRIALPNLNGYELVNPVEIIRCEGKGSYTTIHIVQKEKLLLSRGLYFIEDLLVDYGFIKCHQSHLLNRRYVKSIGQSITGPFIKMTDGTEIPVSSRLYPVVQAELKRRSPIK